MLKKKKIVTNKKDKEIEEIHITGTLQRCGYRNWTFKKLKKQMGMDKEQIFKNRKDKKDKSKGLVVITYG